MTETGIYIIIIYLTQLKLSYYGYMRQEGQIF